MLINEIGFPYFTDTNNSEDDLKTISSECFKVKYTNTSKKTRTVYNNICYVFREIDAKKLIIHWNNQFSEIYQYEIVSITKG